MAQTIITPQDVLYVLKTHGALSSKGISEKLGMPRHTCRRLVTALKKSNLIKEVPAWGDLRRVWYEAV